MPTHPELKFSDRSNITPFRAMEVMRSVSELKLAGRDIVEMHVGQPGAPAPLPVREAAERASRDGRIGYTAASGIRPLREAIAAHYDDEYGISVDPDEVFVTTGSSGGFQLAFLAAMNPGGRVLLTRPGYPAYRNLLTACDLEAVEVDVGAETGFTLTPDHIRNAHAESPLGAVLLASPANPTGVLTKPETLREISETCAELGIWFISDEIYHRLIYEGQEETALRFGRQNIVVNSFSKYYCMTGWRIGWMIAPPAMLEACERLCQNIFISAPEISQIAAVEAFKAREELDIVRSVYSANRAHLVEALPKLGFSDFFPADGAFYLYLSMPQQFSDSLSFCNDLLQKAGVSATPGLDFDTVNGARTVRFSYAGEESRIIEGIRRMKEFLS